MYSQLCWSKNRILKTNLYILILSLFYLRLFHFLRPPPLKTILRSYQFSPSWFLIPEKPSKSLYQLFFIFLEFLCLHITYEFENVWTLVVFSNGTAVSSMSSSCNMGCGCTEDVYKPICSVQDQKTYYSPCYAGCTKQDSYSNVRKLCDPFEL